MWPAFIEFCIKIHDVSCISIISQHNRLGEKCRHKFAKSISGIDFLLQGKVLKPLLHCMRITMSL